MGFDVAAVAGLARRPERPVVADELTRFRVRRCPVAAFTVDLYKPYDRVAARLGVHLPVAEFRSGAATRTRRKGPAR